MKKLLLGLVILGSLTLGGCTSQQGKNNIRNTELVKTVVVKGRSMEDVEKYIGVPTIKTTGNDGTQVWQYSNTDMKIGLLPGSTSIVDNKQMTITFDKDGKVIDSSSTSTYMGDL